MERWWANDIVSHVIRWCREHLGGLLLSSRCYIHTLWKIYFDNPPPSTPPTQNLAGDVGNGSPNQNRGTVAQSSRWRSSGMWRFSNGTNNNDRGSDGGGGRALLTTGVSQPTINPTWPVSDTSWFHADAKAEQDLDSTRCEFVSYDFVCMVHSQWYRQYRRAFSLAVSIAYCCGMSLDLDGGSCLKVPRIRW